MYKFTVSVFFGPQKIQQQTCVSEKNTLLNSQPLFLMGVALRKGNTPIDMNMNMNMSTGMSMVLSKSIFNPYTSKL